MNSILAPSRDGIFSSLINGSLTLTSHILSSSRSSRANLVGCIFNAVIAIKNRNPNNNTEFQVFQVVASYLTSAMIGTIIANSAGSRQFLLILSLVNVGILNLIKKMRLNSDPAVATQLPQSNGVNSFSLIHTATNSYHSSYCDENTPDFPQHSRRDAEPHSPPFNPDFNSLRHIPSMPQSYNVYPSVFPTSQGLPGQPRHEPLLPGQPRHEPLPPGDEGLPGQKPR